MAKRAHSKGGPMREVKEFDEEVIQIDRVTRVVKGGRKLRFRATVAIGNRKGKLGLGIGKSHEVTGAIQKAIAKAKKTLITVPLDGTTIPHDIRIKVKSSRILMLPAAPGTGIIAGSSIRKLVDLAGIKDILSKSLGTSNRVNNAKATFEALQRLKITPLMERKRKAEAQAKAAAQTAKPAVPAAKPAAPVAKPATAAKATAPAAKPATPTAKPPAPKTQVNPNK